MTEAVPAKCCRRLLCFVILLLATTGCFETPRQFKATVLDADTGKPVSGCDVQLTTWTIPLRNFDSGGMEKATGRTQSDEQGVFELRQKYSSVDTLLITKPGYYPIHYGQHELKSWPDKFELHPVDDPQNLPIITSCFKEIMHQSREDDTGGQRRIIGSHTIELPPGYPISLHFDWEKSGRRGRGMLMAANGENIEFRFHGTDRHLFYAIKEAPADGYSSDFELGFGVYTFRTADGGYGKMHVLYSHPGSGDRGPYINTIVRHVYNPVSRKVEVQDTLPGRFESIQGCAQERKDRMRRQREERRRAVPNLPVK